MSWEEINRRLRIMSRCGDHADRYEYMSVAWWRWHRISCDVLFSIPQNLLWPPGGW